MIDKESFYDKHIRNVCQKYGLTYELTQRAIYALGMVEALCKVGLDFVFKGGSSLMLLFKTPKRLSTDVDILVSPDCDIDEYIKKASEIFPFVSCEESIRKTTKSISKKHFRIHYQSPKNSKTFSVIVDVLFSNNNYKKTEMVPINGGLLLSDETNDLMVKIPTHECLLADKLTAFAPHTIGINFYNDDYSNDKRLEVIKQFYDVASLFDLGGDFILLRDTYYLIAKDEIMYRGKTIDVRECLIDSFNSALSILSLGKFYPDDYVNFVNGFKRISEHVIDVRLNPNNAYLPASKIMLLTAAILKNIDPFALQIEDKPLIKDPPFNQINRLKNINPSAYNIAATAIDIMFLNH